MENKTSREGSKNKKWRNNFTVKMVGVFDLDYEVHIQENSSLAMTTKIYGYGDDRINIREAGWLEGQSSRGLIKSRIAVRDRAVSEIINELTAAAPEARGHVTHELARVTHEAAIGRVGKKQVQTLMARSLKEEEAIDLVVNGMLR